jgi:hypothetical protein
VPAKRADTAGATQGYAKPVVHQPDAETVLAEINGWDGDGKPLTPATPESSMRA